jgi:O-antigen ligase
MKLDDLRRKTFPPLSQRRGVILGWLIVIIAVAGIVSAKSWAVSFPIFFLAMIIHVLTSGQQQRCHSSLDRLAGVALLFFCYVALSLLWTPNPQGAFIKVAAASAFAFGTFFCQRAIASETSANLIRMGEGLWIALLVGVACLAADLILTGGKGGIRSLSGLQTVMKISFSEVTRAVTPVTMLLGPALLCIRGGIVDRWNIAFSVCLLSVAAIAVMVSPHETSKLALMAWLAVLGIASLRIVWAHRMLLIGWITVCVFIVPLAFLAERLDLQHATWMQSTAQQRILIWRQYATLIAKAPILGHGFDMSRVLRPEIKGLAELPFDRVHKKPPLKLTPFHGVHPHNAYLQIWFELGAVGAFLFMFCGIAILQRVKSVDVAAQPLIYATLGATATVLLSSYGLWQVWLLGLLAFTTVACGIGIRIFGDAALSPPLRSYNFVKPGK